MSILNAWGGATSAVIAVDTLTIEADGVARGHASKLHVMPAARSVYAWRGPLIPGMGLSRPSMSMAGSLDDLEAVLPEWLPRAVDAMAAGVVSPGRGIDFLASGWSTKRRRLAAIGWKFTDAGWQAMDELGGRMALTREMYPPDFDPAPQLAMESARMGQVLAMHQLLRRQVQAWRVHPDADAKRQLFDCGGCGIVAHLQADTGGHTSISVHNLGSIEPTS